jgi:hypothetical protein
MNKRKLLRLLESLVMLLFLVMKENRSFYVLGTAPVLVVDFGHAAVPGGARRKRLQLVIWVMRRCLVGADGRVLVPFWDG